MHSLIDKRSECRGRACSGLDRTSAVTEGFNTPPDFQSDLAVESRRRRRVQGVSTIVDEPCGIDTLH
ncbi:MAG: hypothetical protein LBH20_05760 [Treponema sp.]|nr:hypothetical protein [Treponema sp.]